MTTYHFHNKTTLDVVRLVLNIDFASFNSSATLSIVGQSTFEDRKERLTRRKGYLQEIYLLLHTYLVIELTGKASFRLALCPLTLSSTVVVLLEEAGLVQAKGGIRGFGRVQSGQSELKNDSYRLVIAVDIEPEQYRPLYRALLPVRPALRILPSISEHRGCVPRPRRSRRTRMHAPSFDDKFSVNIPKASWLDRKGCSSKVPSCTRIDSVTVQCRIAGISVRRFRTPGVVNA